MKTRAVAVIPARGGSKRIPGKNVRSFFGKPMIQYSVEAARESGLFDRVVVSTDSREIADVAVRAGAEVPALRPEALADDHTPTIPVLLHAFRELIPDGSSYELGCCILATAPFLQSRYLKEGFELIRTRGVSSVLAVTRSRFPIFRAMKLSEEGQIRWVWPEHESTRSNDLPTTYHDAGQFFWFDVARFLKNERILMPDSLPVELPGHLVQDIDTPEDWSVAEQLYRALRG